MSKEIPANKPEKKEVLEDNARKFIVDAIDPELLKEASSFTLTTDWLETGEDNETKVARKQFDNGDIQILLISKITKDGSRASEKQKITEEEYTELTTSSILHLEKKRHEFTCAQSDALFSAKYDEFADEKLRILEVDASSEEARSSFNPNDFPGDLTEVTGDIRYYGYRIAAIL